MSKTILLIENDAPFAEEMSGALEAMGYLVRVTGDGKVGLDLAKDLKPDAIVLCVELPKLSGYSICNKLKKDDALRTIPLILTSSEATEEVFEDHKKLKVRAEDYLIKPYVSAALLEKIAGQIGMSGGGTATQPHGADSPAGTVDGGDEEVVSLEEDLGLEPFGGEPEQDLPALDLDSLPDEPAAATAGSAELDEDLRLLDDAFDGLSAPAESPAPATSTRLAVNREGAAEEDARAADEAMEKALGIDRPVTSEDLDAASASLPEEDESGARADLGGLADEADLALGSLGGPSVVPAPTAFAALDALDGPTSSQARRAASLAPALAAGGVAVASSGSSAELARLETDLRELRAKLDAATRHVDEMESALGEKEAESASLEARVDALAAQAKKAETDVKTARDEARRATEQTREAEARAAGAAAKLASAEGRCRAAEQEAAAQRRAAEQSAAALASRSAELATAKASATRLVEAEHDVERLESDLLVARGELEGTRSEVERRAGDLKRRIAELEAANSKNEERVVKAYLKIKGDEKVRDKARKALTIALQLLDEGLPAEPAGERRPRPVPE